MYILNRQHKGTRVRWWFEVALAITALAALGVIGFGARQLLKTETAISSPPAAVVTKVYDKKPATKVYTEQLYRFALPTDWEQFAVPDAIAGAKSWRNTAGNKGVRVITIYTDAAVQNLAVNRVLPVRVEAGNRLLPAGDISDNCVNFTSPGVQQTGQGVVRAKWQGVEFLCDTGNYVRNVTAVSAAGSVNGIVLSTSSADTSTNSEANSMTNTGERHGILITYTDNSPSPDFAIFTDMVRSFQMN